MLEICIKDTELWDEKNEKFIYPKGQKLKLEHSLVSISKWESKWHVPFYNKKEKTEEQVLDYIKCMTITQNVDSNIYNCLTNKNITEIMNYIDDPMTATVFYNQEEKKINRETITSERIYYWMITLGIPVKFEKWHINRLITLIELCSLENQPPKKMSRDEILARNRKLNLERRKALGSKG